MRPAALMRGPMRKPISDAVKPPLRRVELRDFEQCAQSHIHRAAQPLDAEACDDAVLAQQRYGVGDSRDHQHLQERGQQFFAGALGVACFEQRLRQLECHACAAEMLAGIGAIRLVGVEDGERLGQPHGGLGQMVIGDDQIQREPRGFLGGGKGADAGVHADDEFHPVGRGACQHLGLHAIAITQTMRDVIADGAAENLDRGLEQNDGRRAVDVVIAIDEDRLTCRDRLLDASDCHGHAVQRVRIEQMIQRGMEELRGRSTVRHTALRAAGKPQAPGRPLLSRAQRPRLHLPREAPSARKQASKRARSSLCSRRPSHSSSASSSMTMSPTLSSDSSSCW